MEDLKKNAKPPKVNKTEKETESKNNLRTSKDKKNLFADKPQWIFKEPADMEKPRT